MAGTYAITPIDLLEHDITLGRDNTIAKLDATHVVVGYAGAGLDGYIKIIEVDGSYNLTETSSLEHDNSLGRNNAIVVLDANTVALLYRPGNPLFVKIFSIDGSYNITEETFWNSASDATTTFSDVVANVMWNAVKIDSSTLLITYTRGTNDLHTMILSVDGSYNVTEEDELLVSSGNNDSIQYGTVATGNDSVIIATGDGTLGVGRAYVVSWDGTFTMTLETTFDYEASTTISYTDIAKLTDTIYVISSRDNTAGVGRIYTISYNTGTHALSNIDNLSDAESFLWTSVSRINDTHFFVVNEGVGADGFIRTYSVDSGGDNITELDELEHDTLNGGYNDSIMFDNDHCVIIYEGNGSDGYVASFNIDIDLITTRRIFNIS